MLLAEKIIFVPFIHAFGGVERLILGLSCFLHEHEMAHTVVCFRDTINFQSYAGWPMTVRELASPRNPVAEAWALKCYMRAACAAGSPPPLLFDLKGAFYGGVFPVPDFYLHLTDPPSLLPSEVSKFAPSARRVYPSFRRESPGLVNMVRGEGVHRINRRGARRAVSVIAMTNAIAEELRVLYSIEAKIIRPGVKKPIVRPSLKGRPGKIMRMLSVCRLESSKRIDQVLNALAGLESSVVPLSAKTDWILDVAGDGSQREHLQTFAVQAGIAGRVVFHGKVGDARLEELFADASLFLMPAVQGYGLPALEALARGIPVILHRESGVSEILAGTLWAEIIKDSAGDLSSAINKMVGLLGDDIIQKSLLPEFPSETDWAREICTLCKWI